MLPVAVNVPFGGGFVTGGGGGGGGGPPFLSPAARGAVVAKRRLSTTGMMSGCVPVFITTSFQWFCVTDKTNPAERNASAVLGPIHLGWLAASDVMRVHVSHLSFLGHWLPAAFLVMALRGEMHEFRFGSQS